MELDQLRYFRVKINGNSLVDKCNIKKVIPKDIFSSMEIQLQKIIIL
jgi:hypothetical protein